MATIKYHYEVNDHGSRHEVASHKCEDDCYFEFLAQECAEDYHSRHDGWGASWPMDMKIYEYSDAEDGKELWRGSVDREAIPSFSARTERKAGKP